MSTRRRPPSDAGFQPGSRSHGTPNAAGTPGTPRRAPASKRPTKSGAPSHKTSQIPRPTSAEQAKARAEAEAERSAARDESLTAALSREFTRPIAREKQLVRGRGKRWIIVGGLTVIGAALVGVLFVLPVKAWLQQQDDIERKQLELVALEQANAKLTDEVERLKTPEGIEEAAREEIGYVQRGERRLTVLPEPDAPLTLPTGWPYDAISQIIVVKSQGTVTSDSAP